MDKQYYTVNKKFTQFVENRSLFPEITHREYVIMSLWVNGVPIRYIATFNESTTDAIEANLQRVRKKLGLGKLEEVRSLAASRVAFGIDVRYLLSSLDMDSFFTKRGLV